jgi:transcriptional regulator with XRE-family HTH domain
MPRLSAVFPNNVRSERARLGLDQDELGKLILGWSRSMVSDLETGRRKLNVDDIGPICRALGVTLNRLALGCDDPDEVRALGLSNL